FNANQTISAMPGVLALATAGATDLATTSDIASNIMGGFNIDPEDTINGMSAMSYVSDVLAKTITSANVDMRMLGETMKYVAPVAKTAGMSLQETSAMAGLLGNIGIQGSMAGTTLKSMVLRLASPTGQAQKALSKLGVSALDAQGNIRSMPLLLKEVAKATEDMGSGDRLGFIKRVFGTEPAAGINKLIEQSGSGALDKYLSVVNQYKGSAKKIADIQLQSTAGHFKLLGSAMEGLSISATTGLLPTIKLITKGLTGVASKVEKFTKTFPEASKWIFGLGAAFVVGSVALAGFGLIASGVGAGLALLASPVTAIVLGLVAIGAGAVYLYNKFDFVKSAVDGFFSGLMSSVSPAVNALKSAFSGLFGAIGGLFNSLKPVFSFIGSALSMIVINFTNTGSLIGSIFGAITFPIRMVVKALTWVINIGAMVVDGWVKIGGLAGDIWSGVTGAIKKPFVSFFDWISSKFKAVFGLIDKAKSVVNAPIDAVKSGASKLWSGTKSFFGFGNDKKEPIKNKIPKTSVPVNNVNFKGSSLKEAQMAQVPLESVSDVTAGAINETKSFMQNNTNNTQGVNQNIINHITVHAPAGGQVDYEDLKMKLAKAQKELAKEEQEMQMQDVS
ncbi:MAG TPA: phage tail tape measure protein, partial [Sulfurimonas sp.]|nr:phage tail tape measure protein [Sulfurimonas sp.]